MNAGLIEVVVLVVLRGHGLPTVTDAVLNTVREVLGASVSVRLEERATFEPSPALPDGTAEARLSWDEPGLVALLQVRGAGDPIDRSVTFSAADDSAERGRTVGYVLVAALPLPLLPPNEPRAAPAPVAPSAPAAAAPLRLQASVEPPRPPPAPAVLAIDLLGLGSLGLEDDGATTSLGGGLGLGWLAAPGALLGLRLDARTGHLAPAQATVLWLSARAGGSWTFLELGRPRRLAFDVRGDFGLARETVTHFSADDPEPVAIGRWLAVGDVWLEAALWPRPGIGLVLGLGADLVLGRTDVIVDDDRAATLGAVRPMIALGVRVEL